MNDVTECSDLVQACVDELRPQLGLAFAVTEDGRCYGITRTCAGALFEQLRPGDRVLLGVGRHQGAVVPLRCTRLPA